MKRKYIIGISLLVACMFAFTAASAINGTEASEKPDMGATINPEVWSAHLDIDDGTFFAKGTDWVLMGEATDANDGPPADGRDAPHSPFPPAPYLQSYFADGLSGPYAKLYEDWRHYCDGVNKQWILTVAVDGVGSQFNITWNPSDFAPSEYGVVNLRDASTSAILAVMYGPGQVSSYLETVTADPGFYYYDITCENPVCPVEGDSCYNPYVVNVPGDLDYSVAHTTDSPMTPDYQDTDLGSYDGGNDTIYQLNVATDTMVKITMLPNDSWTGIGLFTDCPEEVGTMVASDTGSDKSTGKDKGLREIEYTLLASESPYFLMCDSWPSPQAYDYDLDIITIHDVGVTAINEPTLPVYNDTTVPVQVQVENFGNDETSVPVHVWITDDTSGGTTVLIDEDFEGAFPPAKGWTVTNNGGNCVWERNDVTGEPNHVGTGYCADANSDWCGSGTTMNTDMITDVIDMSSYVSAYFECLVYWQDATWTPLDKLIVMYTLDGSTWSTLFTFDGSIPSGGYLLSGDVSSFCGSSTVQLSWTYIAGGWDWYAQVDDVYLDASTALTKAIVYDNYQYPNIDMGDSIAVDFPNWYVDHGANYTIHAQTELPTDQDDTNNATSFGPFWVQPGIHDCGFISVDTPPDHTTTGYHTISGTVENFGDFDETGVPVNCKVFRIEGAPPAPSDLPYLEDFETAAMGWSDWTVLESPANGDTWARSTDYGSYDDGGATGYAAVMDDDGYGSSSDNPLEELISPVISCAGETGVMLDFDGDFEDMAGYGMFWVHISNDGSTWNEVFFETVDVDPDGWNNHPGIPIDISAYADNEATVQIKFTYSDTDDWGPSGYAWYCHVDNVAVYSTPLVGQGLTKDTALDGKELVLVYESGTTTVPVDVAEGGTASVTFTPDCMFDEASLYLINLTTMCPADQFPDNDAVIKIIDVHEPNVKNLDQGTWWTTIQGAVDAADPGDTLAAIAIVFNENVNVYKEDIQIIPYEEGFTPILNGDLSTIAGPGIGFNISADGVAVHGFEIIECTIGVYVYQAMDAVITNNTIHNNGIGIGLETTSVGTIAINYNYMYANGVGVKNFPAAFVTLPAKDKAIILDEHFEGTWALDPDGDYYAPVDTTYGAWDIDGVCTGYQSGYPQLTHYISQMADYGGYGLPYDGTYCAGLWWNDGVMDPVNPDEWLKTPVMNLAGVPDLELSFYGIWLWDSIYDDHVYIKVSTDGGGTWTIMADLLQDPAYEQGAGGPGGYGWCWNEYQVVLDVNSFVTPTATTQFAYQVLGDPAQQTTNGICYIDAFLLTGTTGPTFTLTVDVVGNGHVDVDGSKTDVYTFPAGTVVTLEAIPDPGQVFAGWSGDLTGNTNPETITMDDHKFVTATFEMGIPDVPGIPGIHYNWFGELNECDTPGIAIENDDTQRVILDARWNWYDACDGPSGDILDAVTGRPADGFGFSVSGAINFDPWAGIDAFATASATEVLIGDPIVFDASESFACMFDGTMHDVQYYWSFEDGFYSFEEETGHVYDEAGIYEVYLRVSANDQELQGTTMYDFAYITITVSPPDMPLDANADANFGGGYEGIVEEPVQFYGSATGGMPPYSYEWNFGDGTNPVDGKNPIHSFDESGTYTVTLTVTDDEGSTATDTADVVVAGRDELVANAGGPYDGMESEGIFFSGSATGGEAPYSYEWSFGDGSTAEGQYVQHIYDTDGTYTATLTVTDNVGNVDDHTTTVTVNKGESVEIRDVRGGLGIKATIKTGDVPADWTITIDGKFVFGTTSSSGTIDANRVETVKTPFAIGLGKVDITITAGSIVEEHTAFMLGPFVLAIQ